MCLPEKGEFCLPEVDNLVYATVGDLTPIPRDPSRVHIISYVVKRLLERKMLRKVNGKNGKTCLRINFE